MQNQIPKNWQKVKLGDVADDIRELYLPKKNEHLKYIGLEHIEQGTLRLNGIGDSSDTQSIKKSFNENDVLFGTLRAYFRKIVKPKFSGVCSTDIAVLRAKNSFDQNFLFYFIANPYFIKFSSNPGDGTRMPRAKWNYLSNTEWFFPEFTEQQKIASVLSAFDYKIEVNNKIAKTLVEMAQALFKEWFVHFRFPGYEKAEFVDSELGKIPKGWEVKKIKDIAKIKKGISYSSEEIKDNSVGLPMINLANFQRGGGFNPDGIKFYTGGYKTTDLVKPGDIVIAMTDLTSNREVIGHPARVPSYIHWDKMLISLDVCVVDTEKLYMEFLYYLMLRKEFSYLMASSAGGTNVAHLSKSVIENYSFVLPERNLIKEFQDFIRPIFSQINKAELENQKLAALRDLLLPKLMKGEIRV